MKKRSILFVLAVVLIALLASCNDESGLFEDASKRPASSDLTILSILGQKDEKIYFLSLEKGVHVLDTANNEAEILIDKTNSNTPNFFDAGMINDKIYVRQYADTDKAIEGGQIAQYDLEGNLTTQTSLVLGMLAPNGYGLKAGAANLDGNFNVYQGTGSTGKFAKNIIYANGENIILVKKSSPTDVFFVNNKEFTSDILLVSCVGNFILAGDKTIRNTSVTTITDASFTIPSNPIGFQAGSNVYFRGTKNFVDETGTVVDESWAKPFDSSVEITGAVTIDNNKVYLSTKNNGIWCVDFSKSTPESKSVL